VWLEAFLVGSLLLIGIALINGAAHFSVEARTDVVPPTAVVSEPGGAHWLAVTVLILVPLAILAGVVRLLCFGNAEARRAAWRERAQHLPERAFPDQSESG
jgi:hypothetical protein